MSSMSWGVLGKSKTKQLPPARYFHAAVCLDDRYIFIHGGFSGMRPLSCCWVLDLSTASWTEVGRPVQRREECLSHHLAAEGGKKRATGEEQTPCGCNGK